MLRPGEELVGALGGLHRFMAWDRALLTDSGGFQVYSLAQNRKITEEGASFQSHLDGSRWLLTPERSVQIQESLGADVIMAFDECPPSRSERAYLEESLARTTRWLHRCAAAWSRGRSALFGIVQGGLDLELRRRHLDEVCAVDLPGLRARRLLGGRAPGGDARLGRRGRAAPPRGPAALPDGRGHAGGPRHRRRRRRGHVRLRAAHPVRAQRPALHHPGAAQPPERHPRPRRATA